MGNKASSTSREHFYPILAFCDFEQRGTATRLCKSLNSYLSEPYFKEWLCRRLHEERRLYSPQHLPTGLSWDELFKELWVYRNLWTRGQQQLVRKPSPISVSVRFRPHIARCGSSEGQDEGKELVLPLHQRLQMLKAQNVDTNHRLNTNQAIHMLKEEGSWFPFRNALEDQAESARAALNTAKKENQAPPEQPEDPDSKVTTKSTAHAHVHTISPEEKQVLMVAPGKWPSSNGPG